MDEVYPPALAEALRDRGIDTATIAETGLAGRSDLDVFSAATEDGRVVVTENVSDFARIAADCLTSANHHPVSCIGGVDALQFILAATGRSDPAALGLDETVNIYRA